MIARPEDVTSALSSPPREASKATGNIVGLETASPGTSQNGSCASDSPPPPAVRAEGLLRRMENLWLRVDGWVHQFLPPALNPLAQLGAMANTCLLLAVLTGILLLFWYTPSVHQAYQSLELLRTSSWLGQLMRSLHRYSSDACLLFILLHALRIISQRRFTGPRWLAWTTGALLLALVSFIGWTGYWLVWDVRAQHAALGTARFIDRLPIFAEPLSRSFLTDQSVPSLLFFLIFFVHMLAPLAVGVGLWMHLMRVNRSRFLASGAMTLWITGSLVLFSLLLPAISAAPAQMTVKAQRFTMDWWYLWPFVLTDRLGGGALWAIFSGAGLVFLLAPWWMVKRRRLAAWKAQVDLPRCMGCTLCAQDCPFNAITMVARTDDRKFPVQSQVNPDLCVGCGICTGSCDSQAINLPAFSSREIEKRLLAWIDEDQALGQTPLLALCCGESAGSVLKAGPDGRSELLPGYRIQSVPCVGWISAVMLERTLQRGAGGVLVVGCAEGDPVAREGLKWFGQRLEGGREPAFDPRNADPGRVMFLKLGRVDSGKLAQAAREFQRGQDRTRSRPKLARAKPILAGMSIAIVLGAVTLALSNLPYRTSHSPEPELVISFNHGGAILEPRQLTREELEKRLPHMRAQVNVSRERAPVRVRVQVDGRRLFEQSFQPKGLSRDGPSIAIVRLPITAGRHEVQVDLADTADASLWTRNWKETVQFENHRAKVLLFDTKTGFSLH